MTAEFLFFSSFSFNIIKPLHSISSVKDLQVLKQMITYPGNVFMWMMFQRNDIWVPNNRTGSNTQTTDEELSARQLMTQQYTALPHSPRYTNRLKAEGSEIGQWMNACLRWEFLKYFPWSQDKYKDRRYEALCSRQKRAMFQTIVLPQSYSNLKMEAVIPLKHTCILPEHFATHP